VKFARDGGSDGFDWHIVRYHVIVFPDTRKDAMEKLAREIVSRLAGLKPLENQDDQAIIPELSGPVCRFHGS
jgi:hypothetical protein